MHEMLNILLISYLSIKGINQNLEIFYDQKNYKESFSIENNKCGAKQENSAIIYGNIKSNYDCNLVKEYNNLIKDNKKYLSDDSIQKNEKLFTKLFEKNLIPRYNVISSGNLEIYMGLGDIVNGNPELSNNKNLACKTYYGDTYTNLCLIYIKNSNSKSIKVWNNNYDGERAYFKNIDDKNLEYVDMQGAIGVSNTKYELYKIKDNNIIEDISFKEEMNIIEYDYKKDEIGYIENYKKGNLSLIIYNDIDGKVFKYGIFKSIDTIEDIVNHGEEINENALFKHNNSNYDSKIIPIDNNKLKNFNGKFEIDEKTNLMNGDNFEFLIDGKKFIYNTKDLKEN